MKPIFTYPGTSQSPKRNSLKFKQMLLLDSARQIQKPLAQPIKVYKRKIHDQILENVSPILSNESFAYSQKMHYLNSSQSLSPESSRTSNITFDNKLFELYHKLNKLGKHQQLIPNTPIELQFEGYQIKLFEIPVQTKCASFTFGVSTKMKPSETILLEIYFSNTFYPNLDNCTHHWLVLNDQMKQQIKLESACFSEKIYVSICSRVTIKIEIYLNFSTKNSPSIEKSNKFALHNIIDEDVLK